MADDKKLGVINKLIKNFQAIQSNLEGIATNISSKGELQGLYDRLTGSLYCCQALFGAATFGEALDPKKLSIRTRVHRLQAYSQFCTNLSKIKVPAGGYALHPELLDSLPADGTFSGLCKKIKTIITNPKDQKSTEKGGVRERLDPEFDNLVKELTTFVESHNAADQLSGAVATVYGRLFEKNTIKDGLLKFTGYPSVKALISACSAEFASDNRIDSRASAPMSDDVANVLLVSNYLKSLNLPALLENCNDAMLSWLKSYLDFDSGPATWHQNVSSETIDKFLSLDDLNKSLLENFRGAVEATVKGQDLDVSLYDIISDIFRNSALLSLSDVQKKSLADSLTLDLIISVCDACSGSLYGLKNCTNFQVFLDSFQGLSNTMASSLDTAMTTFRDDLSSRLASAVDSISKILKEIENASSPVYSKLTEKYIGPCFASAVSDAASNSLDSVGFENSEACMALKKFANRYAEKGTPDSSSGSDSGPAPAGT